MINSSQQALAVQTRRFNAGKKGFSKAVRAYVIRSLETKLGPKANWTFIEWNTYHAMMASMPHKF